MRSRDRQGIVGLADDLGGEGARWQNRGAGPPGGGEGPSGGGPRRPLPIATIVTVLLAAPAPVALLVTWIRAAPPPLAADARGLAERFDTTYALQVTERLTRLGPRSPGSEAHSAARAMILRELGAVLPGARVVSETTPHGERANITAERLGGHRDDAPILVGAHYDTVEVSPGATDDAAGVGITLALARLFGRGPGKRPIAFVLWDGEETELGGSMSEADRRARTGRLPHAVLSLDLVGWQGGTTVLHTFRDGLWVARSLVPAGLVGTALASGSALNIDVSVGDPILSPIYQTLTRLGRIPFDADDAAYARFKIPALFVSDSSFTRFAPVYHTPLDRFDMVSAEMVRRAGQLVAGTVAALEAGADPGGSPFWAAIGGRLLQGSWIQIVAALAALPLITALERRKSFAVSLTITYGVSVMFEPAAALLWLAPAVWLSMFGLRSRVTRTLTGLLALLVPVACLGVYAAAAARFGLHRPRIGLVAASAHVTAFISLVGFVWNRGAEVVPRVGNASIGFRVYEAGITRIAFVLVALFGFFFFVDWALRRSTLEELRRVPTNLKPREAPAVQP